MEPLYGEIRPGSTESRALLAWIAERRRRITADLASINCEPRAGDVYRGQLAELHNIERALIPSEVIAPTA